MINLPPLPEPVQWRPVNLEFHPVYEPPPDAPRFAKQGLYTADQLREYAKLAVEAERESVLDLVDAYAKNNTDLAAAIRARGETK